MAANRQVITNHVHEHIDKEFEPGLAANVQMYADTYEMKNALHILDEARRPVELSQNRQGRLGSLSGSLKMIRPQMVTLSEQQRNVVKAGVKIAEATDLHKLYRACEEACKIAVKCTHSAFLIVDPLDSGRLVSESISKVMKIAPETSVVGHAAATKETLNMAVADMSDWPTRDPRDDNGMDPNQFHQSFSRDPTKSVLCVPVLDETKTVLGVLYVENEAKKQHFKRSGARRQSSRGSTRNKKGIEIVYTLTNSIDHPNYQTWYVTIDKERL